jgi:hypothetical protein
MLLGARFEAGACVVLQHHASAHRGSKHPRPAQRLDLLPGLCAAVRGHRKAAGGPQAVQVGRREHEAQRGERPVRHHHARRATQAGHDAGQTQPTAELNHPLTLHHGGVPRQFGGHGHPGGPEPTHAQPASAPPPSATNAQTAHAQVGSCRWRVAAGAGSAHTLQSSSSAPSPGDRFPCCACATAVGAASSPPCAAAAVGPRWKRATFFAGAPSPMPRRNTR